MKFKIPIRWMVSAQVEVEATTLDEAIADVRENPTKVGVPVDHLDDSLCVDEITARELAFDVPG